MSPDKVSPAVVWLCGEDAADVTGRTFVVGANKIFLLSWQSQEIARKDPMGDPMSVAEVGAAMRGAIDDWPKLLTAADFMA